MPRNPGILRTFRWCYRTLILLAALAMVSGLLAAGGPARAASAAVAAPSSAITHSVRFSAGGRSMAAVTAPSGDLTLTFDGGTAYDPSTMRAVVNQVNADGRIGARPLYVRGQRDTPIRSATN